MNEERLAAFLARQPLAVESHEGGVDDGARARRERRDFGSASGARGIGVAIIGVCVLTLCIIATSFVVLIAFAFGYSLAAFLCAWGMLFVALGMGDLRAARSGGGALDWAGAGFGGLLSGAAELGLWAGAEGVDASALVAALPVVGGEPSSSDLPR